MILNFKKTEQPQIDLGNLGLHNACSYYVPKDPKSYPFCYFARQNKKSITHIMIPGNPEDCPDGYEIYEQFDTPMERLLWYADWIKDDHKDLPNEKMQKHSPFIGRKRSARWEDERLRRRIDK